MRYNLRVSLVIGGLAAGAYLITAFGFAVGFRVVAGVSRRIESRREPEFKSS